MFASAVIGVTNTNTAVVGEFPKESIAGFVWQSMTTCHLRIQYVYIYSTKKTGYWEKFKKKSKHLHCNNLVMVNIVDI